jgi:hypothetical protein
MIAGDIDGIHLGEAIQECPAADDDIVQRIAQQFEKITDDDQLPALVLNVPEKRIEQRLTIGPAQVVAGGSIPDVQIADNEDWLVLVDTTTLSYFPKGRDGSTPGVLLYSYYRFRMLNPHSVSVSFW